uniref:Synaptogyrin n=1 Tax=Echinococcus granulosus TaxID=6210 RepID=A0A068WMJ6_ECHGR|nr:synaptogyrin [Echinococcus granulosus]
MGVYGYKADLRSLLTSPNFVLRGVSVIFCIIILACIDRDGYFAGRCMFYSSGSACSFALSVTSLGLIFCLVYMAIDAGFLCLLQKYRRYIAMVELGFSGFWTCAFFILFCYTADHWRISDADPNDLDLISLNNIRASIAFAFFSIFSWGGMTYTAYNRYISIQNYNQYADDVTEASRDPHRSETGGGYIDYFNHSPSVAQASFDASATMDDEFIADGQHRAGDTDLSSTILWCYSHSCIASPHFHHMLPLYIPFIHPPKLCELYPLLSFLNYGLIFPIANNVSGYLKASFSFIAHMCVHANGFHKVMYLIDEKFWDWYNAMIKEHQKCAEYTHTWFYVLCDLLQ